MELDELLAQYSAEDLYVAASQELPRKDFLSFFREAWEIIEPVTPLVDSWHVGMLCDHLEAVARGEITRLVINIPPGFLKSIAGAVMLPAWVWTWRPGWRSIWTSYAGPLATRDALKCRKIIESAWYEENFSGPADWTLAADQNEKTLFANTMMGFRQSFGIGAGGTGHRGNLFATDDPISADDGYNKQELERVIRWWDNVVPTRLSDPRKDSFLCIMQRLNRGDLSQHLLDRGYQHLCLMQEFERKRTFVTYRTVQTVAGPVKEVFREDPREVEGELLCPVLYPQEVVDELRSIANGIYKAQQQQDPQAMDGDIFKLESWRFFRLRGMDPTQIGKRPRGCFEGPAIEIDLDDIEEWAISVDCKFKDTDTGSFVSMGVWGRRGIDRFRFARRRGRYGFIRTCDELKGLSLEWPLASMKLVEAKAQGPAVISTMETEISGLLPWEPEGSKISRAYAVSPDQESGHVFLMDGAPWLDEYTSEHAGFPSGKNDDQVDETTQILCKWKPTSASARAAILCSLQAWGGNLGLNT